MILQQGLDIRLQHSRQPTCSRRQAWSSQQQAEAHNTRGSHKVPSACRGKTYLSPALFLGV